MEITIVDLARLLLSKPSMQECRSYHVAVTQAWFSQLINGKVSMGLVALGFQFGHIDFHPNHPWAQIMWTYRVAPCNSQTTGTLEFSFSAVQVKQKGMRNSKESKKNCWETKVPTWPRWLRLDFRCHQDSL